MRFLVLILFALLTVACQTSTEQSEQAPSMSLNEAKKIAADFKHADFVAPPRSANDLKKRFGNRKPVPRNCAQRITKRWNKLNSALTRLRDAAAGSAKYAAAFPIAVNAEEMMAMGRFDRAIEMLVAAIEALDDEKYGASRTERSGFVARLARFHSRLGNLSEARNVIREFERIWERSTSERNRDEWAAQTSSIKAELAFAEGNLPGAERHFRSAIKRSYEGYGTGGYISEADMWAGLSRSLILQGRLSEAESAARESLDALGIADEDVIASDGRVMRGYRAKNAAPVGVLADIYLEQGRTVDAEYIARTAINMFEFDCAAPESLGLNAAKKTLVHVLAEQKNWDEVLNEIELARDALKQFPDLFQREFGRSLERIEAEIQTGDPEEARLLLDKMRAPAIAEYGESSYQVAEIDALVGLTFARRNRHEAALQQLPKNVSIILSKNSGAAIGTAGRRGRIIDAYVELLRQSIAKGQKQAGGIDLVAEMLRVTAFHREATVGQALSAGYLRASVGDPDLSNLIRREQDIVEETRAVGDILAYVSSSSDAVSDLGSASAARERLQTLRLARQSLRDEIQKRFPDFGALTQPSPMTVAAIRKSLAANQSLLVFHVAQNATYAWAVPANATQEIAFSVVPLGEADLADKVDDLRDAVDPGLLRSLGDIPRFDVELSHELYKMLLDPIHDGWKDAREIVVVANRPLGALPFAMLVTKPGKGDDGKLLFSGYRQVAWLGRDVGITYMPSVNSLKTVGAVASNVAGSRPFVGFGDPYFNPDQVADAKKTQKVQVANRGFAVRGAPRTREADSAELSALPRLADTRDEILAVANALGADATKDIFLGVRASESKVKTKDLSNYRVLSFATHGLVPGDLDGLRQPGLALSAPAVTGERDADGLLTMNEILGLKLNADFAVLSACNTAAADGQGAEAVSGLGRAFFYAGARSLLVSNWPVHSGATTDLMTRLFKSLAEDNALTRSEALRRTKLQQVDNGLYEVDGKSAFSYAHPIFWAPFTIIGDGGGLRAGS